MSFLKTLQDDKTAFLLATAAGAVIAWGIYMLGPDIGGFTVTIAASAIAFMIGRVFSSRNFLASALVPRGRAAKGFYQTARVTIRKRPAWLAQMPFREIANRNFRVEDWQHGEYA